MNTGPADAQLGGNIIGPKALRMKPWRLVQLGLRGGLLALTPIEKMSGNLGRDLDA
jgi:hypothetical protein